MYDAVLLEEYVLLKEVHPVQPIPLAGSALGADGGRRALSVLWNIEPAHVSADWADLTIFEVLVDQVFCPYAVEHRVTILFYWRWMCNEV